MSITIYNKLVRDRIPDIILASGKECVCEILHDDKYLEMLDQKLIEECNEYCDINDILEMISEG